MKRKMLALAASVSLAIVVTAVWAQSMPKNAAVEPPYQVSPTPMVRTDRPEANLSNPGIQYNYLPAPVPSYVVVGIDRLLEKWKQTSNKADREKIQQNLRAALLAEFQARLSAHEKEVDDLEAEVKRLRQQLELRRQKQDDIVRFHMDQLLREAQGLGWGTEPVHSSVWGRPRAIVNPTAMPPAGGIGSANFLRQPATPEGAKPHDGATNNAVNPYQKTPKNAVPAPGPSVGPPAEAGPLPKLPPGGAGSAEELPPGETPINVKRDQPESVPGAP